MRYVPLCLALLACTDPDETDTSADSDTDADTDSDTDTDTDVDGPQGTFTGDVTDEGGAPVVGAHVNFCRSVCVTTETDAAGHYSMQAPAQTGSFYVRTEGSTLDAIVPLTIADAETRTVDVTLYEPGASAAIPDTAEEVELTPGFFVTAGADTVEPAVFETLGDSFDATEVTEDAMLPVELDEAHGAFVAAWYLGPFEATAINEAGLPFAIDNTYGLAADQALVGVVASGPDRYTWLSAGDLVVSSDGSRIEGGMLPIFTTLVIFEAP